MRCTFIHGGCPRSLRYDCQRCQLRTNRRSVIYCPVRIWRAHLSIPVAASWRAASRKPAACAMGCFCCFCALVRRVMRISTGSRVCSEISCRPCTGSGRVNGLVIPLHSPRVPTWRISFLGQCLEHVLFDQESDVLRNRSIHIRRALFKRHVGCRVNIDIEPVIVSHCARPKKYPAANHGCRVQRLHSQRPGRTLAGSCCGLLFGDQGAVRDGLQLVGSADRDRIAPPAYSLLRDPKRLGQLHLIAEVFDCLFCLHLVHQQ